MDIELQGAIYSALTAGSPGYAVYDHTPQNSSFPYVVIGDGSVVQMDTDDTNLLDVDFVIHTYSRYDGSYEIKTNQKDIYNKLHRASLSVSGYNFVGCTFQSGNVFLDVEGKTRHGIQSFRIILEEI